MKSIISLYSIALFAMYLVSGVAMLWAFICLYIFVTPYDERVQIRDGKMAPTVALVGAMIGFTIPIVTMSYHGAQFVEYLVWSIVAGAIQLVCFKFLHWFMPQQIEADNVAVAVFYAGASVCVGLINAFSLIP